MAFKVELDEIKNFLIEPYELFTISSVIQELKKMKSKDAKLALKLIDLKNVKILKTKEKNVDKAILKLADKSIIVATNDIKLRRKLKALGIKTIYLRARKYLAMS
jgi:rRNA-processing protein FCF1